MIRLFGAGLVALAASAAGFGFAQRVRVQCAQLDALSWALETMTSEMSARLTPLPEIFLLLGSGAQKDVSLFFKTAAMALTTPPGCTVPVAFKRGFAAAMNFRPGEQAVQALYALSAGLGRFTLERQLAAIEQAKTAVTRELLSLQAQKQARCRSYGTIGVCAGLALAVILL